jgi:hypothetical protein
MHMIEVNEQCIAYSLRVRVGKVTVDVNIQCFHNLGEIYNFVGVHNSVGSIRGIERLDAAAASYNQTIRELNSRVSYYP